MGNPSTIPTLKDLIGISFYYVKLVFTLSVLMIFVFKLVLIYAFFFVDAKGQSGGLTMFWKTPFNCCLLNYYFNFINMKIHLVKIVSKLIVYYGFQKRDKRKGSWNLL